MHAKAARTLALGRPNHRHRESLGFHRVMNRVLRTKTAPLTNDYTIPVCLCVFASHGWLAHAMDALHVRCQLAPAQPNGLGAQVVSG